MVGCGTWFVVWYVVICDLWFVICYWNWDWDFGFDWDFGCGFTTAVTTGVWGVWDVCLFRTVKPWNLLEP